MYRLLMIVAVVALGATPVGASTDSGSRVSAARTGYRPPVDRPVLDPFRAPLGPYGAGNRGLEYAGVPGDVARAIGPGVVVFAGPVAGRLVVSVVHPDGLRSSLTGLASISVTVGQIVQVGDPLGSTGARLHLGVREGDRYLDPARLFTSNRPRHAVLVPTPARGG